MHNCGFLLLINTIVVYCHNSRLRGTKKTLKQTPYFILTLFRYIGIYFDAVIRTNHDYMLRGDSVSSHIHMTEITVDRLVHTFECTAD